MVTLNDLKRNLLSLNKHIYTHLSMISFLIENITKTRKINKLNYLTNNVVVI